MFEAFVIDSQPFLSYTSRDKKIKCLSLQGCEEGREITLTVRIPWRTRARKLAINATT